ncbi:hypothetical protein L484_000562 [Morus notabilis]|uniref:Uncharacterized protein n=1 Tax=Morus notabilis TaxID=981085 RepID=W9RQ70_9ROSA|nr:hypothetical protein L484_000562 [Morus notabilis]
METGQPMRSTGLQADRSTGVHTTGRPVVLHCSVTGRPVDTGFDPVWPENAVLTPVFRRTQISFIWGLEMNGLAYLILDLGLKNPWNDNLKHENGLRHTNSKSWLEIKIWITLGMRINPKVLFCISDRRGFRLKGLEKVEAGKGNASPRFDSAR